MALCFSNRLRKAVAHWAVACGLNCISDPTTYMNNIDTGVSLLGPPESELQMAERVNLWWAIFILDRRVGLGAGLPPRIDGETRVSAELLWHS